ALVMHLRGAEQKRAELERHVSMLQKQLAKQQGRRSHKASTDTADAEDAQPASPSADGAGAYNEAAAAAAAANNEAVRAELMGAVQAQAEAVARLDAAMGALQEEVAEGRNASLLLLLEAEEKYQKASGDAEGMAEAQRALRGAVEGVQGEVRSLGARQGEVAALTEQVKSLQALVVSLPQQQQRAEGDNT
ncbi:unnamed protein product, partial [Closterium sp. Naga37s-1]